MTPSPPESRPGRPQIWVEGLDEAGEVLGCLRLPHGCPPRQALSGNGFHAEGLVAVRTALNPYAVTLTFRGRRLARNVAPGRVPTQSAPARDPGLLLAPNDRPVAVQRLAAYGLVVCERGVLLAQLSERTNAPGRWGLPGGGVAGGEGPHDALVREVCEETGQRVQAATLLDVTDSHWLGRSPDGSLEDFHAVRLVFAAVSRSPTDPVVHDHDGTTAAAAWVAPGALASVDLADPWRGVVPQWLRGLQGAGRDGLSSADA